MDKRPQYLARQQYILDHAEKQSIDEGLAWYQSAHDISESIAIRTSTPGTVVRRVLSKISPSNPWETSLVQAENLIRHGAETPVTSYNYNKVAALKMIEDHSLHLFNFKQAPKTTAFWENMEYPDRAGLVTLDRHALRSFGLGDLKLTPSKYLWLSDIVSEVATKNNLLPHEAQAIIWIEQRANRVPDWDTLESCFG